MSPHWPSTPLLHTKGQCGTNSANVLDIPEHVETLEITIVNLSPSAHVFHLHGMYFQVINYGYPEWCDLAHHNQCFFMPYAVAKEVARKTINGTAVISDPDHPLLGHLLVRRAPQHLARELGARHRLQLLGANDPLHIPKQLLAEL